MQLSELVKKLAELKSLSEMTQEEWDRRRAFIRKQAEAILARTPAILACGECAAEIKIYSVDAYREPLCLCGNCEKKLMRELIPNGFPKPRTLISQIDGQKVWREPRG